MTRFLETNSKVNSDKARIRSSLKAEHVLVNKGLLRQEEFVLLQVLFCS